LFGGREAQREKEKKSVVRRRGQGGAGVSETLFSRKKRHAWERGGEASPGGASRKGPVGGYDLSCKGGLAWGEGRKNAFLS